jgi:hypothetical protein
VAKLSDTQIEAIIAQQIELARSHDKAERATARDKALDYYFGNMDAYVPPETNRSKVVSRDVADTINWLMPEIMKVFTASGRMFLAEPVEPEDLEIEDEITDGLNFVFWKDNFGYGTVYDGTWDALMHGDGIVKTFYDDEPVYGPAKFHDQQTEDQRAELLADDSVEALAQTPEQPKEGEDPLPPETLYDLKIRRKKADGRFIVTVIPPEEFLVDGDAITLEDAAFKDHWQRKTRSALIEMGYPKQTIWEIPEASRNETPEQAARRAFIDTEATDKSMELVDYHECFMMVDADGDGVAEMIRACYGGPGGKTKGALLDWEVWEDEDPFDSIPCEPIPHRLTSRSVADEEIDIQDVKTVLTRQMLNNTYWTNNPQRFVTGKIKNPDQLDNPTFGGNVFGDPGATITDLNVEYIGDKALQGIHYMDEVSSRRTGVNSQSMALDPEVIQNQSATANQNATNASRSQPELIARNMAEYGWKKVGRKLLRLMHAHQKKPRTILVKGKPVQITPENWNPDMHVNVNTGLGTGSRDKDAMMLGQVLGQQVAFTDRIAAVFPEKGLDMLPYIHNTLTRFAESTGLKNPELYWPEIDPQEIEAGKAKMAEQAQQPPIEVVVEQARAKSAQELEQIKGQTTLQTEQGKLQFQMQLEQAKMQAAGQSEAMASEAQVRREQAQLAADLQTKEADRQNAIVIAQQQGQIDLQKQANDLAFKQWEAQFNADLEREKMANAVKVAAAKPKPDPAKPTAK